VDGRLISNGIQGRFRLRRISTEETKEPVQPRLYLEQRSATVPHAPGRRPDRASGPHCPHEAQQHYARRGRLRRREGDVEILGDGDD
jgi:hypothetical protein